MCLVCRQGRAYCFFVTASDGLKDWLEEVSTCNCSLQSMPTMPQVQINFFENYTLCEEFLLRQIPSLFSLSDTALTSIADENVEAKTGIALFLTDKSYKYILTFPINKLSHRIACSLLVIILFLIGVLLLRGITCAYETKPAAGGGGGGGGNQSSGTSNGLPVSSPVPPTPLHCATSQCPCQYIQNHLYNKAKPAPNVCWRMPNFGFH